MKHPWLTGSLAFMLALISLLVLSEGASADTSHDKHHSQSQKAPPTKTPQVKAPPATPPQIKLPPATTPEAQPVTTPEVQPVGNSEAQPVMPPEAKATQAQVPPVKAAPTDAPINKSPAPKDKHQKHKPEKHDAKHGRPANVQASPKPPVPMNPHAIVAPPTSGSALVPIMEASPLSMTSVDALEQDARDPSDIQTASASRNPAPGESYGGRLPNPTAPPCPEPIGDGCTVPLDVPEMVSPAGADLETGTLHDARDPQESLVDADAAAGFAAAGVASDAVVVASPSPRLALPSSGIAPVQRFVSVSDFPPVTPGACGRAGQYWSALEPRAHRYQADPELLAALLVVEGSGQRSVSPAGALGLMQLMPDKFQRGDDPFDIATNFSRAAQHIALLQRVYGAPERVAAAYFGAIDRAGNITGASDGNVDGFEYVRRFQAALQCVRAGWGNSSAAPSTLLSPLGVPLTSTHVSFGFQDDYGPALAMVIRGARGIQDYGTHHLAWDLILPDAPANGRGAPVYAPIAGQVIRTSDPAGGPFGLWIENQLGDLRLRLMHMDGLAPGISTGTSVQAGQWLGILGAQGTESFPHLHLSIERLSTGGRLDPAQFYFTTPPSSSPAAEPPQSPGAEGVGACGATLPMLSGAPFADWDIFEGRCFAEQDGLEAERAGHVYALTNANGISLWDDYRHLGGVERLGRPMSDRFELRDGFTYQVTERALLQWRPEVGHAILANGFELLEQHGSDAWLYDRRQIPHPVVDDGAGSDWSRARTTRLAWMTDAHIRAFYLTNPDPTGQDEWSEDEAIALYGLPMSEPEDFGPFTAQRFQRAVLQHWTTADSDPVTVVRFGEIFRELVINAPDEESLALVASPPDETITPSVDAPAAALERSAARCIGILEESVSSAVLGHPGPSCAGRRSR